MKNGDSLPSIFAYNDFRCFLKDYQAARQKIDPAFTKSAFSRFLLLPNTRSYFTDVLKGKKVTEIFIERFVSFIGLPKNEAQYFRILVRFNQSESADERELLFDQLIALNCTPKRNLEARVFSYYSKWYHGVIRALLEVWDFDGNYAELAGKIRPSITPAQVKGSIKLLLDLGLIEKNSKGLYKPTEKSISACDHTRDQLSAISRFNALN